MFHRACFLVVVMFLSLMLICLPAVALPMIHGWSKGFGGANSDYGFDVAVDSAGNIIAAGEFYDTVDFGGGALTGGGVYLAKFDASGNHLWSKSFANASVWEYQCLAIDGAGNIILMGDFSDTIDFGGGVLTSAGLTDIFLAKFDASGNHLWSKRFGDLFWEYGLGVTVDGDGNIILTGQFITTVDFGGGVLTCAGGSDMFLAKFGASGTHLWSQRFGDADSEAGYRVATDCAGNIAVTGYFDGTVDFGGGVLTSAGLGDIFLAKFDASGTHLWSQGFGDEFEQTVNGMAMECTGSIVVTGYFEGTVDFGGGVLTSAGMNDIFLAKFDAAGTHLWSQRFGDSSYQYSNGVAIDGAGNAIITGYFRGNVDFGGGTLTALYSNVFIARFNASGSHLWSEGFGYYSTNYTQAGYGVTVDGAGNAIVTGSYNGYVDFGGGELPFSGYGYSNIFLVKFLSAEPKILTILDIPNDQGKQVRISWLASGADYAGSPITITGYSIFRKIDSGLTSNRVFELSDRGEALLAYPPGEWDFVASAPARAEYKYFMVVPTLADSTKTDGMYYTTFFVSALTGTPGVYYDSAPDSGYSADNLSPAKVGGLAVAYNTGSGNQLTWDESLDEDLEHYCVYRGSTPDFTPGAENRVDAITTTEWTDPEYDGCDVYYKITAVDFSGNESDPASAGTVTAVEKPMLAQAYGLYPNVPNPFNPNTSIRYDVPVGGGAVALRIYDASGRLVRTLVDGQQPAGQKQITWNGTDDRGRGVVSGVYFYCLQAPGYKKTLKMILIQ
jgi:hypothetical protein